MKNVLVALSLTVISLMAANENWNSGRAFGSDTLRYFKSNTSGTIVSPMTTTSQLNTVDGTRSSSNARVTCSENQTPVEFMSVEYSGSSDIAVTVAMDRDFDGVKETTSTFDGVSGVCSNGVIKCSPNSWSSCNYYMWSYGSSGVSLLPSQSTALGGCYCINSSCQSLAATAHRGVLNDLAGGVASVVNDGHRYVITRTSNNGQRALFWGQNYSTCNNGNIPNVSSSNIQSETDNTAMNQSTDPTSAYYVVNRGAINNNSGLDNSYKTTLDTKSQVVLNSAENTPGTGDFSYDEATGNSQRHVDATVQIEPTPEIKYCEVMWEETNTDAYSDGQNRSQVNSTGTSIRTEIRECVEDWTVCPVNPGETIKHPCGEVNDFAEVTAGLYAVNEAAKDMVCSASH